MLLFRKHKQMKLREDNDIEESGMDFKYRNWKTKDLSQGTRPNSVVDKY